MIQKQQSMIFSSFINLIKKSIEFGREVQTVIGDTAYSEKGNIVYANENEMKLVAKRNPSMP